jgi:GNAT superfamily N-acetyltransferase
MSLVLNDISDESADFDCLSRFYDGLYIAGFPDANERESLANMKRYLQLRREGWYGPNNYHIILALDGDRTVAASVSDYLAKPNCGVIEFLLVDESIRGSGIGKMVHTATIEVLDADAHRIGRSGVDGIVIELNDPFRVAPQDDNYDPFERAMIWDRWGYGRLCFPYVQPALSDEQEPVTCLLLGMKPIAPSLKDQVPAATLCDVLEGYLRWAMRIDEPELDPTFAAMKQFLSNTSTVHIEPFSVYIGREPDKPISIRPIKSVSDPAYKIATDLYARVFPPGPTIIEIKLFDHALKSSVGRIDLHYHLWALSQYRDEQIFGMASFFVMREFAFGGYMALEPPLRGSGRARTILRRIEEQIIRDERDAQKYYIECALNSAEEAIFRTIGFSPIPVRYLQPPPTSDGGFGLGPGPELRLLHKRLGSSYGPTPVEPQQFLADLKMWLREVYGLAEPERSHCFQIAQSTIGRVSIT